MLVACLLEAGVASAWTTRLAGSKSIDNRLQSIASDADGNLLTAGDGDVTKDAASDGARLWRTRLIDAVDTVNFLNGVTSDAAGDVVVTGVVSHPDASVDALIVKLAGTDGRVLWRVVFDGASDSDYPSRAAIDANGDVIVGGSTYLGDRAGMLVAKFDGRTGVEKWHQRYARGEDQGLAIAVNPQGDVVEVGDSMRGNADRFAAIKVSGADGTLLWRSFAGGPKDEGQATAVAFDGLGDVLVVGAVALDAIDFDATVVKFDGGSGAEKWHRYIDGSAHRFDFGNDVEVDADRNVVMVGEVVNQGTDSDVLAVKLGPDGGEIWRTAIDGGQGGYDSGNAVAIAGSRVVIAAGIDGKGFDDTAFAALGLDAASGTESWRRVKKGDAGGRDWATLVTVNAGGGAFVGGGVVNRGTKNDGLVLDLDASSGAARWNLTVNDTVPDADVAEAVAVDGNGDTIAVGRVGTRNRSADFSVVKLAGTSGAPLWRASIDGAIHQDDDGRAVAVDRTGDVVALGLTVDADALPPTDPRFPGPPPLTNVTAVKLDGATGAELWRSAPSFGGRGFPQSGDLALDANDDVFMAGWFGASPFESKPAAVKLDGSSGAESWRFALPDLAFMPDTPVKLAVDALSDVVVAEGADVFKLRGATGAQLWYHRMTTVAAATLALDAHGDAVFGNSFSLAATKLSGLDGGPLWSVDYGQGRIVAVAIDPAGDVLLAGATPRGLEDRLVVLKLAGATGALRWMQVLPGRQPSRALALVVDATGDALVAGAASVDRLGEEFAVVKVRGQDGVFKWRRTIDGGARRDDHAQAIALDPRQNPVAVGVLSGAASGEDFAVVKLDGRTGRYR